MDWFLQSAMEKIAIYIKLKENNTTWYNAAIWSMADAIGLYIIHQYSIAYDEMASCEEDYKTYISFKCEPEKYYNEMIDLLKKYFQ